MLDETRAKLLQDVYYISNQNPLILNLLTKEVVKLTEILTLIHSRKIKFYRDFEEDIWNASTQFVQMYLKNPNWYCNSFRNRIYLDIINTLHKPKVRKHDDAKLQPLDDNQAELPKAVKEDDGWVLEDVKFDHPDKYKWIMFECYRARTFKSFILKLSTKIPKRWIYDNATKLNKLYKFTRRN